MLNMYLLVVFCVLGNFKQNFDIIMIKGNYIELFSVILGQEDCEGNIRLKTILNMICKLPFKYALK